MSNLGMIRYLFYLAVGCGVSSTLLGSLVLLGWYLENVTLIQVSPIFVPMQYNTALCFLLSGIGLLSSSKNYSIVRIVCGVLVALIGGLTLVEYIGELDLGIDQLFMEHYITVQTSHPGRMAPNTALCFFLTGVSFFTYDANTRYWRMSVSSSVLGSLVLGLGLVALTGYTVRIETAYGWGELTRMAVHTASGFIVLGIGTISLSWHLDRPSHSRLPSWFPIPVGIGVLTISVCLWQALYSDLEAVAREFGIKEHITFLDEMMLGFGVALSIVLSMAIYLAQTSRSRDKKLEVEVSMRKEIMAELQEAKREAEIANSAKSEFLAAMSHDLRTPLNAIMGFAEMMEMRTFGELGDSRYERYVKDIHDSGTLLVSLINDVLDISKIEAGKYELIEKPLDISKLIQSSFKQLSQMAESSRQNLSIKVAPDFPEFLGDERALTQILNNLISNAIKFTPEGGEIEVTACLERENEITLRIIDNGVGMSEEGIVKALKPFEQADSSHPRSHEGSGLGLHLCVNLMDLFGGKLEIDSEVENGTTVILRFPSKRTIFKTKAAQESLIDEYEMS